MILRDRELGASWTDASGGTLDERRFYLQNWRADVSALCDTNGRPIERIKYSAYGTPITLTDIDFNSDGNIDPDDTGNFVNTPYDWNLDGSTNSTDNTDFLAAAAAVYGAAWGCGYASLNLHGNRIGYAGYIYDRFISGSDGGKWHVRHRVLDSGLGRWTRRDPLGYVDGMGLFEYVGSVPLSRLDPKGLACAGLACPPSTTPSTEDDVFRPPTAEQQRKCCEEGDQRDPPPPEAQARTICCNGHAIMCMYNRPIDAPDAIKKAIQDCVRQHEHHIDHDVACEGTTGVVTRPRPRSNRPNAHPCAECNAYRIEVLCLRGVSCPLLDISCQDWLRRYIEGKRATERFFCNQCR